eukprot:4588528-Amphidinium_carterae.2
MWIRSIAAIIYPKAASSYTSWNMWLRLLRSSRHSFNSERMSAGDGDSFGKNAELPPQAIKEYERAVKNGLNLAGVAGSLNWLALRSRQSLERIKSV